MRGCGEGEGCEGGVEEEKVVRGDVEEEKVVRGCGGGEGCEGVWRRRRL